MTTSDAPTRRKSRRLLIVTAAVALALLPLVVLALVAPRLVGMGSPPNATTAVCAEAKVRPFGCTVYRITAPETTSVELSAWFDVLAGQPRLVLKMSERLYAIPFGQDGDRAITGEAGRWATLDRDCFPDSECGMEQLLAEAFRVHRVVTRTSTGFTVEGSALTFTDTGQPHRYPEVTVRTAGPYTLLTVPVNDVQMEAFNGGLLSVGPTGCLTDGQTVVVLPDTTVLHDDGSIEIEGRRIRLGEPLDIGGGMGSVPGDQRCGLRGYWYL